MPKLTGQKGMLFVSRMESSSVAGREQLSQKEDSWCEHSKRLKSVVVEALGRFHPW